MNINSIAMSGGHNEKVTGANCYLDEVKEDRAVLSSMMKYGKKLGLTCYDCTDNVGRNQSENLSLIVKNHNAKKRDLDVSVHLNAYQKEEGDGKTKGSEVLVYSKTVKPEDSKAYEQALKVCGALNKLGFTNRGVKVRNGLAFLKNTDKPAMLIEVCFVDDKDDYNLYKKVGSDTIGRVIMEAITGRTVPNDSEAITIPSLKGYKGFSIVDGLKKFGYESSFEYRKKLWVALGYGGTYKGTASQNLKLLNRLKRG